VPTAALLLLALLAQDDLQARGEALAARLEAMRGLKFKTPLKFREGNRIDYARFVLGNARKLYGEDLGAAGDGLKALGLIPRALRLDVAVTTHAGLGVKVFCTDGELVLLDAKAGDDWVLNKMALGLIDQHHAPTAAATYDAQMALAALRMGDAEVVKYHVLYKDGPPADLAASLAAQAVEWETSGSKLASAVVPRVLVRTGDFPWRRGAVFALGLHARGGFAAIDRAYAKPPSTTEQVLHPEKYAAGEAAAAIDLSKAATFLKASGWAEAYATTLGELGTALVLESHFPREDLGAASAGWAGDALAVFTKDGQGPLVLWATAWDREADAAEFHAQAVRVTARLTTPGGGLGGAQRRGMSVLLTLGVPGTLQDKALAEAWAGTRDGKPLDDGR
jgi:hypothetical protein